MNPFLIISLLIIVSSSFNDFNYLEIDYIVRAKTSTGVLTEKRVQILYSDEFFETEAKHLSLEFQFPRQYLSELTIEVEQISSQSKKNNKKKSCKLAKPMYVKPANYGLETVFGVNHIILSNKVSIQEVYPQTIYLKILYDEQYNDQNYLDYVPFIINQNIILDPSSYKPVRLAGQMVKIVLIPELFTSSLVISDKMVSSVEIYYGFFETYYLSSYNQALELKDLYQFYNYYETLVIKSIKLTNTRAKNKSQYVEQGSWEQMQTKKALYELEEVKQALLNENQGKEVNFIKDKALDLVFQFLQLLKKIIFFNQSGYYTVLLIFSALSILLEQLLLFVFLWKVIKNKLSHYRDHAGLSMTAPYLVIVQCLLIFLCSQTGLYGLLFLLFLQSILRIQFQKQQNFPYYRISNHPFQNYYSKTDIGLMILNGFSLLLLLTGYYLLFGRHFDKLEKNKGIVGAFTVCYILMSQYMLFFLGLNQYFINNHLKSVRHLSKSYIILFLVLALTDNHEIFWDTEPLFILLRLKQEIVAILLIYQCFKWNDLGQGSRKYFAQKLNDEYLIQRKKQLQIIKNS